MPNLPLPPKNITLHKPYHCVKSRIGQYLWFTLCLTFQRHFQRDLTAAGFPMYYFILVFNHML